MKIVLLFLAIAFPVGIHAAPVRLVSSQGIAIEVELVKLEGEKLTISRGGQLAVLTLGQLSPHSRVLVKDTFSPPSAPPALDASQARVTLEELFPKGLVEASGNPFPLESLGGKYICLFFGTSTCGPCKLAVAKLKTLRELAEGHLEVVLIGRDLTEKAHHAYMHDEEMPWPSLPWEDWTSSSGSLFSRRMAMKFGSSGGTPGIIVISPAGEILEGRIDQGGSDHGGLRIRFTPQENIRHLQSNIRQRTSALADYRKWRLKEGHKLTPLEERDFLDRYVIQHEKRISEFEALLEETKGITALSDPPTWHELLAALYRARR